MRSATETLNDNGEPPFQRSHLEAIPPVLTKPTVRDARVLEYVASLTSQRVPRSSRFQAPPLHSIRDRVRETGTMPGC